jgi:6-phosphofructokinase 1
MNPKATRRPARTATAAEKRRKEKSKKKIRKIGILTGGGDCPGLNAVIRAVVRASWILHRWEVLGVLDGYDGLIDLRTRALTPKDVRGLQVKGGTILGTSNRGNPLEYPLTRGGKTVYRDVTGKIVANVRKLGIDVLIAVGGDGTMKIAQALFEKGVPVVGVPKTIDNDLDATDVTFGFNSAVSTATDAIDKLHTTAESHHRVLVLEVMGRDCGWIAVEAGIAGGADVILIPEIPFDLEYVCRHITGRKKGGSRFSIVVAAEGAFPAGGGKIYEKGPSDGSPGRLGGIGRWVAGEIGQRTGIETRTTVLGHLQRGGTPTTFDRLLATRFGVEAVGAIVRGEFGRMVCLRGRDIVTDEIEDAVKRLKRVDPSGQYVRTAESLGISFGRNQK